MMRHAAYLLPYQGMKVLEHLRIGMPDTSQCTCPVEDRQQLPKRRVLGSGPLGNDGRA